ncbi:MAG: ketoacyl-ACP synthase III [Desulfobacteraceae bacterium]|nr:MAG: ketoacyl-ACP synthase III [Desulfobacteraceae bacterium]
MPFAHIRGTGSAVPERVLDNAELEKIVDTTDEWITRRTGIKQRRIAMGDNNESTAALGTRAARGAMEMAGIAADQIDTIIMATITADRIFPSAACMVQKELEAFNAAAYDISAGCSGFLYALESGNNSIKSGMSRTCLIIGAERLSAIVNWEDRGTCVLLGDGAGAVILRRQDEPGGLLSTHIKSDGRLWDLLYSDKGNAPAPESLAGLVGIPFHLKMEGNRLFKQAVPCMASIAEKALEQNGLSREDIQLVIPHQANLRILQAVSEKLKIPMEKFFTNLQHYGNTSAASIPLAMDEAHRQGRIKSGDCVLLVSFGAGLTWGAAVLKWTL